MEKQINSNRVLYQFLLHVVNTSMSKNIKSMNLEKNTHKCFVSSHTRQYYLSPYVLLPDFALDVVDIDLLLIHVLLCIHRLLLFLFRTLVYICAVHMRMCGNERSSWRSWRVRRERIHLKGRIAIERGRRVKAMGIII